MLASFEMIHQTMKRNLRNYDHIYLSLQTGEISLLHVFMPYFLLANCQKTFLSVSTYHHACRERKTSKNSNLTVNSKPTAELAASSVYSFGL